MSRLLIALALLVIPCSFTAAAPKKPNNKRGLTFPAANNPSDVKNFNQSQSQISWVYDWGLEVPVYLNASGVQYIPMQWGGGNIENLAEKVRAQGAKTLLAFNEPDYEAQSNLDPGYAAQLWQQHIEPLKSLGVRLGGPAVTSSGTGQPWLTRFFEACSNCTVDFLPLHWYGSGVAGFYDYLYQMHGQFPKYPIWVTEYADTSLNETDVMTFLNQTTEFLDKTEWIEKYAWFGYFRPENGSAYNFLDADGGLNNLGRAYIGATTVEKSGAIASTAPTMGSGGGPTRSLHTISVPTNEPTPTFRPNGTKTTFGRLVAHYFLALEAVVMSLTVLSL